MKIILHRDYRGRASRERFFEAGEYSAEVLGRELAAYLVIMGWATIQSAEAEAEAEAETETEAEAEAENESEAVPTKARGRKGR